MPTERQEEKLSPADAAHPNTGEGGVSESAPQPGVNTDIRHTPAGGTLKADRGHIDERTREWAIHARARGTYSSNIWRTVTDPEKCAALGIKPVTASRSGWGNCMSRVAPGELAGARAEYLSTFEDVELAQKKVRVLELAKLYAKFKGPAKRGSRDAACECRMLLKQIADEVGEDARLDAVAKSGGSPAPAMTQDLLRELAYLISNELNPQRLLDPLGSAVSDDVRESVVSGDIRESGNGAPL